MTGWARVACVAVATLFLGVSAFAQQPILVGAAASEVETLPKDAVGQGRVWRNKRDYFRVHLDRKFDDLIVLMEAIEPRNGHIIADLKAQQDGWLAYYPRECWLTGALTMTEGTWPSTYAMKCEAHLVDRRLRAMTDAVACIQKFEPDKRATEAPKCLAQLAPLTLQD
jgi:hypothetical protein